MAFSLALSERPIALVGMMGAGKTTVGRLLAARLGLPFHDSDHVIEADSGCSVATMFAQEGEAAFRTRERQTVAGLLSGPRSVIATGGGAVMAADTRALLRDQAVTIWLDVPPARLEERLRAAGDRPLLRGADRLATLVRLSDLRRPFYAAADVRVDASDGEPEAVAQRLLTALAEQ